MSQVKIEVSVLMDDATTHRVVADQRDIARWEVQEEAGKDVPFTRMRFLAYSAMTRQGLTKATWPDFNFRDCVDVGDVEAPETDDSLDPGRPDQSDAP